MFVLAIVYRGTKGLMLTLLAWGLVILVETSVLAVIDACERRRARLYQGCRAKGPRELSAFSSCLINFVTLTGTVHTSFFLLFLRKRGYTSSISLTK